VGTDPEDSRRARNLAAAHPAVFVAAGLHPHDAAAWSAETEKELRELSSSPGVVAVGETGLDFYRDRSPRDAQRAAFLGQLDLAAQADLPVVVHCRDAYDECVEILGESAPPGGGVVHCFSGGPDDARRILDLGFALSFSGSLTYPRSDVLRRVARDAPADRILVETDAPFLAPQPVRGRPNEPAYVRHTAEVLAELRGESLEETAARTRANAMRIFRLPGD
jgi:TatD DNase family protein